MMNCVVSIKVTHFFLLLDLDQSLVLLTVAKLVRSEVEGLDSILGHFQVYPLSEEDGLVLTGVGVANGCLEEIQ